MSLSAEMPLLTLEGSEQKLGDYAGKVLLVVNVASRCGLTPQYTALEALYRRYHDRGFVVMGFPSNQFAHQEPGDASDIRGFCTNNYDVTFPLFAKTDVNGASAHPLFKALKSEAPGLLGIEAIKWNFTKFLVGRERQTLRRFAPTEAPEKLAPDIEAALKGQS